MTYATKPASVLARAQHTCTWCAEPIPAKTAYWRWYSVNEDGVGNTSKMHDECLDALNQDGEGEYCPFENERPSVVSLDSITTPATLLASHRVLQAP